MMFQKDLKNFEKLYKEHFVFLCLVAFHITKDRESAKDIVQDFFIYLWGKKESLEINISFNAYATKAVKNLSLKFVETNEKIDLTKQTFFIERQQEATVLEKTEETATIKIRELVNQIPESRRNIFMSHVVDGLSYVQIADVYGVSVNTVKTQMKRAYAFLRSVEKTDITAMLLLVLLQRFNG
ncbi:MAG: sigma-70 family RNA polymerase sigma factor [Flavobacteriaceae bacterium]